MAEFDELENAVDRHRRVTDEYVRVERRVQVESSRSHRPRFSLLLLLLALVVAVPAIVVTRPHVKPTGGPPPAVVAFPGADGFGKDVTGGRGGSVIEVTNLNDSGTGSLRAALLATGTRTIVFRTGGVVHLLSEIPVVAGNVTIAGQTAPGGGIVVEGYHFDLYASNIIMRGMRMRITDEHEIVDGNAGDTVRIGDFRGGGSGFILDHNSFSWGTDENVDCSYTPQNITVSNNIISEALMVTSLAAGGRMEYGYGMIISETCQRFSLYHNLFASNNDRHPLLKGGTDTEIINNVMYNFRNYGTHSTNDTGQPVAAKSNIINNYYKRGPSDDGNPPIVNDAGTFYAVGNFNASNIGSSPVAQQSGITPQTAANAFTSVLASAGARAPALDSVDTRILSEANSGTASLGTAGSVIGSQTEVGGLPSYAAGTAPTDTDHDGMPDTWETGHGSDPNNAADRNNIGASGYTLLEEYINSLLPSS